MPTSSSIATHTTPTHTVAAHPARRRSWWLAIPLIPLLVGGYIVVEFWSLNAWLDSHSPSLGPLPFVMVQDGQLNKPGDDRADLDDLLMRSLTLDRRVRHMSRSEPRRDPLFRWWNVKVHMETELVNDPRQSRSIQFVLRYRMGDRGKYEHVGTEMLGI